MVVREATTLSGGGDDTTPSLTFIKGPTLWNGSWQDIVGDGVTAEVTQPAAKILSSVDWSVGGGAVDSQDWSVSQGKTYPLPPVVTHSNIPQFDASDDFSFSLDEIVGARTVTATAYYTDGTSGSASLSINAVAPTVNEFKDDYQEYEFGDAGNQHWGFYQNIPSIPVNGNVFSASMSMPSSPPTPSTGATVAFLQLVKFDYHRTLANSGPQVLTSLDQENPIVLDDLPSPNPNQDARFVSGFVTNIGANAEDFVIPPAGSPSVVDDPQFTWGSGLYPGGDFSSHFADQVDFDTYLVFHPSGGIWVALSHLHWNLEGEADFNDPKNNNAADYTSLANWTVTTQSPKSPGTVEGDGQRSIPIWDDQATRFEFVEDANP